MVSICGKVPIQEAPNGLPCAVSDARVRMLGCMDPVDYDQFHILHLFIFNLMPGLFSSNFPFKIMKHAHGSIIL